MDPEFEAAKSEVITMIMTAIKGKEGSRFVMLQNTVLCVVCKICLAASSQPLAQPDIQLLQKINEFHAKYSDEQDHSN